MCTDIINMDDLDCLKLDIYLIYYIIPTDSAYYAYVYIQGV